MRRQDEHVEALRARPLLLNPPRRRNESTGRAGGRAAALCLCLLVLASLSCAKLPSFGRDGRQSGPFENGMAVSASGPATLAGLEVLRGGGNAVDAAVAMGFALAVTFPRAGNLGGGGFMMVYLAESGEAVAIDYREKAPGKATRDMFLDENGEVDNEKARNSIYSSGVPGTVAGLAAALERYGTISLEKALGPAIELAEKGFPVDEELRKSLLKAREGMKRSAESMEVFFPANGEPPGVGETLRQKNLAWTLGEIRKNGPDAFYRGAVAEKIAAYMEKEGGLITRRDLESYSPVTRKPSVGNYRGYRIHSMPPPSSGGVHLVQMLNILERHPLSSYGHNSAEYVHVLAETMKLAYADRSKHLGDPDFSPVPAREIASKKYARRLAGKIDMEKATPSAAVSPGDPTSAGGADTTHFVVADRFGNVVSNTYTLNFPYGSKLSVPGTGVLLNNEMDDFSAKPGVPNAYGLVGGEKNSIAPGKRMLSSMTPTIVTRNGRPVLATGSPGGSRIITTVLQVILNVIDHGMDLRRAVDAPRIHHQWLPDVLYIEKGVGEDVAAALREKGHTVKTADSIGKAQSLSKDGRVLFGAADVRRPGATALGY